jgi:hypothetical protein
MMAFADKQTQCCSRGCEIIVCEADERLVRCIINGEHKAPLTQGQREWLINEADWAGEGSYPAEEAGELTDVELAKRTLSAWQEYVHTHF